MKTRFVVPFAMIVAVAVAVPAQGWDVYCAEYWDSRPANNGWGTSWCELSGSICYPCWEETFGYNCSAQAPCSPFPLRDTPQFAMQIEVNPSTGQQTVSLCRSTSNDELSRNVTTLL